MKTISLLDIAKELGISKATVSYVLNGRGDEKRISKNTQEKIIKYAKEHHYKANQMARGLSLGRSEMIGLVVPNISDVFFSRIARRIEKQADKEGYTVIFSSTGEDCKREKRVIQSMLDRKVDGLIIASCQQNLSEIKRLRENNFPFVLIDRFYPEIESNYVGFDNRDGIARALEYMIHSGRKRIGFVSLAMELGTLQEREDSYRETMVKHGLELEEGFYREVRYDNVEGDLKKVIKEMVDGSTGVDGIVFPTQFLAAEGLRQLKALKVRVPDDLSIMSYGMKQDFDLFEPALTSMELPINEMGDTAVDMLLRNMKDEEFPCEHIRLKTELVVGKSCGEK